MGQYHRPVNFDKREFIHPHTFGDGLKMMEFGASGNSTLFGLTLLLCNSHNRGGGDLMIDKTDVMGRWSGDRIAILGDYSTFEDFAGHNITLDEYNDAMHNVWKNDEDEDGNVVNCTWTDISESVVRTVQAARSRWDL